MQSVAWGRRSWRSAWSGTVDRGLCRMSFYRCKKAPLPSRQKFPSPPSCSARINAVEFYYPNQTLDSDSTYIFFFWAPTVHSSTDGCFMYMMCVFNFHKNSFSCYDLHSTNVFRVNWESHVLTNNFVFEREKGKWFINTYLKKKKMSDLKCLLEGQGLLLIYLGSCPNHTHRQPWSSVCVNDVK